MENLHSKSMELWKKFQSASTPEEKKKIMKEMYALAGLRDKEEEKQEMKEYVQDILDSTDGEIVDFN